MPVKESSWCGLRSCLQPRTLDTTAVESHLPTTSPVVDTASRQSVNFSPLHEQENPFNLGAALSATSVPNTGLRPRVSPTVSEQGPRAQAAQLTDILAISEPGARVEALRRLIGQYSFLVEDDAYRRPLARAIAVDSAVFSALQETLTGSLKQDVTALRLFIDRLSPSLSSRLVAALATGTVNDTPDDDPHGLKTAASGPMVQYPRDAGGAADFFAEHCVYASAATSPVDTKSIPPFIHFVWLGRPCAEDDFAGISSFVNLNPHYQVVLWSDSNTCDDLPTQQHCKSLGVKLINASEAWHTRLTQDGLMHNYQQALVHGHYAAASDILRVSILHALGGTYSDMDRTCVAPLASLRDHQLVLWMEGNAWARTLHNNDFIMSKPGHPFLQRAMAQLRGRRPADARPSSIARDMAKEDEVIIDWTGPGALGRALPKDEHGVMSNAAAEAEGLHFLSRKEVGPTSLEASGPQTVALRRNAPTWVREVIDEQQSFASATFPDTHRRIATCMLDDWRDFGRIDLDYYKARLAQLPAATVHALLEEVAEHLLGA